MIGERGNRIIEQPRFNTVYLEFKRTEEPYTVRLRSDCDFMAIAPYIVRIVETKAMIRETEQRYCDITEL